MSTDITEGRASRLSSLCREYIDALSCLKKEINAISAALTSAGERSPKDSVEFKIVAAKYRALQYGFLRLQPALQKLIRTASQTVEHGGLDDVDELELTVRLADLEASLEQTGMLINDLWSVAGR
ncbi:MAG: hypothetical protein ABFC96_13150 [Thermoguttaceae bacterium]